MTELSLLMLFVVRTWLSWNGSTDLADTPWSIAMGSALADGLVPYRDFSYGAAPFGLYISSGLYALLGRQLWVSNLFSDLCVVAMAALTIATVRLFSSWRGWPLVLAIAFAALPRDASNYSRPALLLAMAAACTTMRLLVDSRRRLGWAAPGLFSGLAFMTKQNVGIYTLLAVFICLWLGDANNRSRVKSSGLTVLGFALPLAIGLAGLQSVGALHAFLDYGFVGKRHYLVNASLSALDNLGAHLMVSRGEPSWSRLFVYVKPFWFVPLSVGILFVLLEDIANEHQRKIVALIAFLFVGIATIYPRADVWHVMMAMPLCIFVVAVTFALTRPGAARLLRIGSVSTIVVVLVCTIQDAQRWRGRSVPSFLPPLEGSRLELSTQLKLVDAALRITAMADRSDVFFLFSEAALLYRLTGLRNPTPYFYPLRTTFGSDGEEQLARRIEARALPSICVGVERSDPLAPPRILDAIERTMYLHADLGLCRWYSIHPPAGKRGYRFDLEGSSPSNAVLEFFWDDGIGIRPENHTTIQVARGPFSARLRLVVNKELRGLRFDPCVVERCRQTITRFWITEESTGTTVNVSAPELWTPGPGTELIDEGGPLSILGRTNDAQVILSPAKLAELAPKAP